MGVFKARSLELVSEPSAVKPVKSSKVHTCTREYGLKAKERAELDRYRRSDLVNAKKSGVVKHAVWLAANDSCQACRAMEGKKFSLDEAMAIEFEGDCRCTWTWEVN